MTLAVDPRISVNGVPGEPEAAPPKSDFERLLDKPFVARPPHEELASQLGVPANQICGLLRQSVMPPNTSDADFLAFLQVAARYRLNPFLREIYAMPKKGGGIIPIVGIDGWCSIVQRDKRFDGVTFRYVVDEDSNLEMCFCTMYVKGQSRPVEVGERFSECYREKSEPWNQMPYRMLRHRAYIQAARLAFGVHGIVDEDEGVAASGYTSVAEAIAATATGKPKKENPFKAGAPRAPLDTPAAAPTGGDPTPQAAPTPAAQPAPAPPPTDTKRRGRAGTHSAPAVQATAAAEESSVPGDIDDPRTNFEIAEDFSRELPAKELQDWLMRLTQQARSAALEVAGVKSILDATEQQLRDVVCNARLAQLEGK